MEFVGGSGSFFRNWFHLNSGLNIILQITGSISLILDSFLFWFPCLLSLQPSVRITKLVYSIFSLFKAKFESIAPLRLKILTK